MMMSDRRLFLRSWLQNPMRVGAVAPSGRALAELITGQITAADCPIIELGPGTGAFTRALIARGVPEHRLVLIEADASFARTLQDRFPAARVVTMDAAMLGYASGFLGDEQAGAVVSGLPLASMPAAKTSAIIEGAFRHLRPGGAFYQFTYFPRCPIRPDALRRLGLEARRAGIAVVNVPPAIVYCIRRTT
jgi:phospholipid N-methyltransferase